MVMRPGTLVPNMQYVGDNRLVFDLSMFASATLSDFDFTKTFFGSILRQNGQEMMITKLVSKTALSGLYPVLLFEKQASIVNTYLGIDKALAESVVETIAYYVKEAYSNSDGNNANAGTSVNVSTSNSTSENVFGIYKIPLTLDLTKPSSEVLLLE